MNDIDLLMTRVAEINVKSPIDLTRSDIDTLIAYYRNQRARRAAGEKLPKPALEKPKPTMSLAELMSLPGPTPTQPATAAPAVSAPKSRR